MTKGKLECSTKICRGTDDAMPKIKKWEHSVKDKENFIYRYIDYCREITDASCDYHEAFALFLLSGSSDGLFTELSSHPFGFRLNLYMLIHGISAISRKSTSMEIAKNLQEEAMEGVDIDTDFSPEGLLSILEAQDGKPSMLFSDEFTGILESMYNKKYMSGLKAILLAFYNKQRYSRSLASKINGNTKIDRRVAIKKGYFCLSGNVTPTICERLTTQDIEDGFLGRFAIISPTTKEPWKAENDKPDLGKKAVLIQSLNDIYIGVQRCREWSRKNGDISNIRFEDEATAAINKYSKKIDTTKGLPYHVHVIIQRMPNIMRKIASLIALGRVDPKRMAKNPLFVTKQDAIEARKIVNKWQGWSETFARGIGVDIFERDIIKVIRKINTSEETELVDAVSGKTVTVRACMRRSISRDLNVRKEILESIYSTAIIERGTLRHYIKEGNKTEWWGMPENITESQAALESITFDTPSPEAERSN